MATTLQSGKPTQRESQSDKLAGAGWGIFFIWLGLAILASIPSWVTLLGIGVITLGVQGARKNAGLHAEKFWVTVGALFFGATLWDLAGLTFQLLPILLILVGGGVLASLFTKRAG